ncbi:MAG TPA: site-specific integrase, partial [Planctomycetota bacterium]|nr:site-specific integrase [Planctomycetota bacterium]
MPVTAAVDPEPRRAALDLAWTEALRCFLIDLRRRGYSLLTLRDYQSDVMRLRRFAGDAAPSEVTGAHVDAALETWRRVGFGLPVLRRKRSALRSFLRFQEERRRTAGRVADLWARASKLPAADRLLFGFVAAAG